MSTGPIKLSLILPAYNEEHRLPPYLAAVREYLDGQFGGAYEVILSDDGSDRPLQRVLADSASHWPQLRFLRSDRNRGKGAAVRAGALASQGLLVLFADADGATPIHEHRRLAEAIRGGADVAVGSRLADAAGTTRARHWLRGLAGRAFAGLARRLLRLPVRDTQCGFKMLRGDVARGLFAEVREEGFLFDLELLALAQRRGHTIAEVGVDWREVPGGHLHPLRNLPGILVSLWRLRRRVNAARQSQA